MKLVAHFNSFLVDTVNLNSSRITTLTDNVDAISSFLSGAPVVGDMYLDVVPQGSLAHRTIIKPLPGREYDADVLLELTENPDWRPKDYVEKLYVAFRSGSTYRDRASRKSRCVRVHYAGDHYIDVVPYMERGGFSYITNRNDGQDGSFERTDPTGYSAWLDEQNRITSGNLIKAIRLMKWLRDYKKTFTCRSVILNVLLGERVASARLLGDPGYYADLPTTFLHLLEDLDEYLAPFSVFMPHIADPACPEVDFNHRWDNDQFLNFRKWISYLRGQARTAFDESGRNASISLWRELFGDDFAASTSLTATKSIAEPGEMFIDSTKGFPIVPSAYRLRIVGYAEPKAGFRSYKLPDRGGQIGRNRKVRFKIDRCNVPQPYEVLWKIKNRGDEATLANCLRGEIVGGNALGGLERVEPTRYRGPHYVECYIIKNGSCVAFDRQPVIIV